ncbi:hypothetical protein B4077_3385 [Bacillus cereus]|uniref:Uncharacterized protein n=1 Tax=Bacillus cereus TaxID=1396 RepID=A0A0G8F5X9_BACCE|nr:hypothetical protein B4077_3385 [Bacillus cereus]
MNLIIFPPLQNIFNKLYINILTQQVIKGKCYNIFIKRILNN